MSKTPTDKTVVSFKDRNHAIDALCRKVFGAEPSYGEDIPIPTTSEPCDAIKKLERDLALCQAGNRVYAEHNSKLSDERDRLTLQLAELREKCDALIAACQWAQVELGKHTRPSPIDTALAMVERREG